MIEQPLNLDKHLRKPNKEDVNNLINEINCAKGYIGPQGGNDIEFPFLETLLGVLQEQNLTLKDFQRVQKIFKIIMSTKQER